jgi:hypothetical protein
MNLLTQALAKHIGLEKLLEHLAAPDLSARIPAIALPEQNGAEQNGAERLGRVCWAQGCLVPAQQAQDRGHPGLRCQQHRFEGTLPSKLVRLAAKARY